MNIEMTCSCGATIQVEQDEGIVDALSVEKLAGEWLRAHSLCASTVKMATVTEVSDE